MPACCASITQTFNEAVTTIAWPELPQVDVYYLIDGEYQAAGVLTNISYASGFVTVDHGGLSRGIIKIS